MELNFPQIFSELPYFPNREKYNKLCSIWPVIRLYLAIWRVGGHSLPQVSHCYIWSFNWCAHGYSNMAHSAAAPSHWLTHLPSTLYSETLPRPMYLSLTAFCFYIFTDNFPFSASFLPLPWVTLSPHVLQHKATVLSIICFRASDYHDAHGIWTCQWQFLQTLLTKMEIISSMQSHIG